MESFSFDPWGKRRAPTLADLESILGSWSTLNTYEKGNLTIPSLTRTSSITNKGFTGHEQLDPVGLIHMGGRVYDAEIGRFLSADPFVQDTTNLQGLNRYSYVQNNPLSYTDPSGYFLKNLIEKVASAVSKVWKAVWGKVVKPALQKIGRLFAEVPGLSAAIVGFACVASGGALCAPAQWAMAGLNAAMTVANGGTLGQAFTGFAVAAVTSGLPGSSELGGMAGALGDAIGSDIGAMLMTSGMIAKAQGGKFIDGVKGFGIGAAAGVLGNTLGKAYRSSPATKRLVEVADSKASADSRVTAYPVEGPVRLEAVDLMSGAVTSVHHGTSFGFHDAAMMFLPGYDFGTCISQGGCSGLDWTLSVVGIIPGGKAASTGIKTASRIPKSLMDEMVLGAAKKGAGVRILSNLKDPKFKGMEKWSYAERSAAGRLSEVHYVRNPKTGDLTDFKFKHHAE